MRLKEAYERLTATVGRPYADRLTGNHSDPEQFLGSEPYE
jgi:hypothetical protein